MKPTNHQTLQHFLAAYSHNPTLSGLQQKLASVTVPQPAPSEVGKLIEIYHAAIPIIGEEIWSAGADEALIRQYQQLFQELEDHIALRGHDKRHKFVIVIPVADRPTHLQSCLQSLLTLCQSFRYGGYAKQRFTKVSVIIADDSKEQSNLLKHKDIARYFNALGIETSYFGPDEQRQQLARLSNNERKQLLNIAGDFDSSAFYHKGPSVTRNITYLKLNELCKETENLLFHFVDSDQEFQVTVRSGEADKDLYAINYFYTLDRIFSQHDVNILTGKVIGDPPVSPAVMAGTFLDDVLGFLHQVAVTEQHHPCQFHTQTRPTENDAAYHDMADLFGFQPVSNAYPYQCCLHGEHDHTDCFINFAAKLNQFFHGEHPTRKSYFNSLTPVTDIIPARTIYTGNYIINPDGLHYFIPFARLKLRMAGPVLGRIIKAECQAHFVSANLPMLHKRTVEDLGKSEFRPGITSQYNRIDLSGEFERQFFGDIMLFTIEKLTALGYPLSTVSNQTINETLEATAQAIRQRYAAKQKEILKKLNRLESFFHDKNNWWNTTARTESAILNFTAFINNIEQNFGPTAQSYELIDSEVNSSKRFKQMLQAIIEYPHDRRAWTQTLATQKHSQTSAIKDKARG